VDCTYPGFLGHITTERYLLLLFWTAEFPGMVMTKDLAPSCFSSEKVAVCTGHEDLIEVDDNNILIAMIRKGF
jgi:hypothetical protein